MEKKNGTICSTVPIAQYPTKKKSKGRGRLMKEKPFVALKSVVSYLLVGIPTH